MTRWLVWVFHRQRPRTDRCWRCAAELSVCTTCEGQWRRTGCDCGLGRRCPRHDEHWF